MSEKAATTWTSTWKNCVITAQFWHLIIQLLFKQQQYIKMSLGQSYIVQTVWLHWACGLLYLDNVFPQRNGLRGATTTMWRAATLKVTPTVPVDLNMNTTQCVCHSGLNILAHWISEWPLWSPLIPHTVEKVESAGILVSLAWLPLGVHRTTLCGNNKNTNYRPVSTQKHGTSQTMEGFSIIPLWLLTS